MADLSQLVSEDSRKPLERLRRVQLWRLADALGLQYPHGAPKTTMVKLLEANDVDPTQPISGIQWRVTNGRTSDGVPHQEVYPVQTPHASVRKGVNADAALSNKLAEKSREEQAFEQSRLDSLEKDNEGLKEENAKLRSLIETRLAELETEKAKEAGEPEVKEEPEKPLSPQKHYWEVYRKAKAMGIHVDRGMKLNEIESLIAEGS